MYLKFVRNKHSCGEVQRGTLYSVHFQPNEMGDYNEHLSIISDAYEIPLPVRQSPMSNHQSPMSNHQSPMSNHQSPMEMYPLPLIYHAEVVLLNGYLRLTFGDPNRKAALHLIDIHAREKFIPSLRAQLHARFDIRIEIV